MLGRISRGWFPTGVALGFPKRIAVPFFVRCCLYRLLRGQEQFQKLVARRNVVPFPVAQVVQFVPRLVPAADDILCLPDIRCLQTRIDQHFSQIHDVLEGRAVYHLFDYFFF